MVRPVWSFRLAVVETVKAPESLTQGYFGIKIAQSALAFFLPIERFSEKLLFFGISELQRKHGLKSGRWK